MDKDIRSLNGIIVKEELIILTKDIKKAILLSHFIYLSEETNKDWIYKSMYELKRELLNTFSVATIARRLDKLVECGWLLRRKNLQDDWDRTYEYKVNLDKIHKDLREIINKNTKDSKVVRGNGHGNNKDS